MSTLRPTTNESEPADQYFFLAAVPLLGITYLFSPLASYMGALLCLTVFSSRLSALPRIAISVIVILSGASMGASRLVGRGLSDDFAWYYDVYSQDSVEWTERIPVYEFGLPILLKALRVVLPGLAPNGLMFVLSTLMGLILLFFVERFGFRDFPRDKRAYCVGMVLLFFSFVLTTQLTRQMLSSVVLVAVFFLVKAGPRLLTLLLASAFHVSALLVYAVMSTFQRISFSAVFLLVSFVVIASVNALDVETLASLITLYDVPRVGAYFTLSDVGANRDSLALLLLVGMTGLMSLFLLRAGNSQILPQEKRTMFLLLSVIVVYFFTVDLTLGPFRFFLVLHAVMAGWFFAYFTRRFPNGYLAVIGAVLIIAVNLWKGRSLYFLDATREFLPWEVYGPFGTFPGYFVFSYLSS